MSQPQEITLIATITLDTLLVGNLRKKVPQLERIQPLTVQQQEDLSLVLSEHLTNVLTHNPQPCQVRICAGTEPKSLLIYDNGLDISPRLEQVNSQWEPEVLAESGRGLWLMKHYFPTLSYQVTSSGNRLCLPLPAPRQRLAVIDDDPMQIAFMEVMLGEDFQLDCFTCPQRALAFLALHPVDLIISDICMPLLDGLSLRRQLLSNSHAQDTPFLFLSGLEDEQLKRSADDLFIDDYVTKPIREAAFLRQKIGRLLNRQLQQRQSAEAKLDHAVTTALWSPLNGCWQGWQLDLAYLVASRGGGDFVFRQYRQQSMLLVIGDVMGHGTQAKFFSYAISGYLYGLCQSVASEQAPAQLLTQLSTAMASNELLSKTLVTLLVLELFSDGRVLIACAGHPPPWLFSEAEGLHTMDIQGVLPGLQAHSDYEQLCIQLTTGQCLLAGTDGLTEQFPGRDCLDEKQLTSALAVLCSDSKPMKLKDFLHQYFQQPLVDDLTLLSLRRL